jgi:hypothetical protein
MSNQQENVDAQPDEYRGPRQGGNQPGRGRGGKRGGLRPRDVERMRQRGMWDEEKDRPSRSERNPPPQQRNQAQASPRPVNRPNPADMKAVKQTPPKNEPLWEMDGFSGSMSVNEVYRHNLDEASIPLILDEVYNEMEAVEPRLRRQLPFAMFQHHVCVALRAYSLELSAQTGVRHLPELERPLELIASSEYLLPDIISEAIEQIASTITSNGDEVLYNLPPIAVPQGTVPAVAAIPPAVALPAVESGSFGRIAANDHNKYECYMSPLVTSKLVTQTLAANQAPAFAAAWNPLPAGAFPGGAIPNSNLLGYRLIERVNLEGLNRLSGLVFPNDDTMAGRLRFSSELANRVNATLNGMKEKIKISPFQPKFSTAPSATQIVRTITPVAAGNNISIATVEAYGPSAFSSSQSARAYLLAVKRERTAVAQGFCYDPAPAAWGVSINANFAMAAPFTPQMGIDRPSLRERNFFETSGVSNRQLVIGNWVRKHVKKATARR